MPGSETLQGLRVFIGRLPGALRKASAESHGKRAGAAGNLQDPRQRWQAIAQPMQDRLAVARKVLAAWRFIRG
jgi:hypothetical protein